MVVCTDTVGEGLDGGVGSFFVGNPGQHRSTGLAYIGKLAFAETGIGYPMACEWDADRALLIFSLRTRVSC